ncbi:MAG: hypothetical protein HZA12_04340, partial [Nitrospirae bacterium]|nr:hypothetical protein [Nitrospirota bacterium]
MRKIAFRAELLMKKVLPIFIAILSLYIFYSCGTEDSANEPTTESQFGKIDITIYWPSESNAMAKVLEKIPSLTKCIRINIVQPPMAIAGDSEAVISWSSVSNATSYNIYWSTITGVTKATGTKITGATSPYVHTGRTNDTTYYYVVTAVNSYGESSESTQTSAAPSATGTAPIAPTNVTAIAGDSEAVISWSSVSDATSYNIYWSTITGVTKATGTKITGATSPYVHTGRTNDTTYYYVVTAVNSYGE